MVTAKSGCVFSFFFFFLRNPVDCKRFHGSRSVVLKVWMEFRLTASASPGDLQEVQMIRLPSRTTDRNPGSLINLYLISLPLALDKQSFEKHRI